MRNINHVAVWAAGVVQFILGAGWYTLLGKSWLAGIGKTQEQLTAEHGNSPWPYIISLVTGLVIAYTIAWLLRKLGRETAAGGAKTGAVLGLALIGTTLAQNYAFEWRSIMLWLINAGYMVVGMAIMGAIVGHWKKRT